MFNFDRAWAIFNQALANDEPTIAFELQYEIGRFVFMMFFSEDDDPNDRHLFLFLGRTNVLLSLKLYGNQSTGSFQVYPKSSDENAIKEELGIRGGIHPFQINDFFQELNNMIPQNLPLRQCIATLQEHQANLREKPELRKVVDQANKIYLIGPKRLTTGKPKEITLRKLYLHVNAQPNVIADFISALKRANRTLAWTDKPRPQPNLLELINQIR